MKKDVRPDVFRILKEGTEADEAIARAARAAVRLHVRARNRIAVGQNGRTRLLSPDKVKATH